MTGPGPPRLLDENQVFCWTTGANKVPPGLVWYLSLVSPQCRSNHPNRNVVVSSSPCGSD